MPAWAVAALTFPPVVAFGLWLGLVAREHRMTRALDDISINDQEQQQ